MKRVTTFWVLLLMALAQVAMAGVIIVPGGQPVSGKWMCGDSVVVGSGAFVERGTTLVVEEGVHIVFVGVPRFGISGRLEMIGTAQAPITIFCEEDWRGLYFTGPSAFGVLDHVYIVPETGLARQAVEFVGSQGCKLTVTNCSFTALSGALKIAGGELEARNNTFLTTGLHSTVVSISSLNGFASPDCDLAPGNVFQGNFLKASVDETNPGDPIDPYGMTTGLLVDYSTNICLFGNEIAVRAPRVVAGVRFLNGPTFGQQLWRLERTIVFVVSTTESALGVLNEMDGDLEVTRSTVVVTGAQDYVSSCFYASRESHILINSTTSVMNSPLDVFFNTSGVGHVDADYMVKWVVGAPAMSNFGVPVRSRDLEFVDDINPYVSIGDSVWTADPMFAAEGEWGVWNSAADLRRYYTLTENSPCIDRGDPLRGHDPDFTRWDIGHDYYDQSSSAGDERLGIVETSRLLAAYPNPFNPTTVIPIEVASRGALRVVVWDMLGREVQTFRIEVAQPGLQNVRFDGNNLASGSYVAQAALNGMPVGSQRITLVK